MVDGESGVNENGDQTLIGESGRDDPGTTHK